MLKWMLDHVTVWDTHGWATMLEDTGEACMYLSLHSVVVRPGHCVGHGDGYWIA